MPTNPISELVSLARETREKLNCELPNGVGNQIDALCDTIERLERENAEKDAEIKSLCEVISEHTRARASTKHPNPTSLLEREREAFERVWRIALWNEFRRQGMKQDDAIAEINRRVDDLLADVADNEAAALKAPYRSIYSSG